MQIESHKSKLNQLQSQLDDHLESVRNEKSNSSSLQHKVGVVNLYSALGWSTY